MGPWTLRENQQGGAFAAILGNGSVITWGIAGNGGDSSDVQDQLKNVQKIQAVCTHASPFCLVECPKTLILFEIPDVL